MDELDKALGLNTDVVRYEPVADIVKQEFDEIAADANENIHNAIELSKQAVEEMISIAGQSQHPKAYEVLNSMIKTYADMSMGLVDLQLKKQRLNKNAQDKPGDTINNNLIVASTADIQRMLEEFKDEQEGS